jgi:hypothetical protein
MPSQLADVDRRPVRGRQHQRAQRFAVALALERAAERQRPGERDRDPENARLPRPRACGRPSRSAKANTSTHDAAKNSVVETISRLRTSTVRSFRSDEPGDLQEAAHQARTPPLARAASA